MKTRSLCYGSPEHLAFADAAADQRVASDHMHYLGDGVASVIEVINPCREEQWGRVTQHTGLSAAEYRAHFDLEPQLPKPLRRPRGSSNAYAWLYSK